MGKRKRRADNNKAAPPPTDFAQHVPQVDLQSGQRSLEQAASAGTQPQSPYMDVMDGSLKRPAGPQSQTLNQNHGSSRTTLLRHCRPPSGRHYSRRTFTNHPDASPSNWKGSPLHDSMLSCKMESKGLLHFPYRESRDRAFPKQERIRSSSFVQNTLYGDVRRMECTICQKRLRKNPFASENLISSNDLSVVAVLVCGHAYHADCLEQKTSHEDRQDPPCPLCESQIS